MVVVVALARPQQALRVCEVVAPDARPVHVLVAFVLDDGAQAAVFCRHRHQTVLLVSALVILEGEGLVVAPLQVLQTILVADLLIVCPHLLARLRIEDHGCLLHQVVARLLILLLVQLRVELILRSRLHVVHVALLHAADLAHGEVPAVGCPVDIGRIVVPRAAVHRQHTLLSCAVLYGDVPAVDVGGVLAVGRFGRLCLALVVSLAPVVLPLAVVAGPLRARFDVQSCGVLLHAAAAGGRVYLHIHLPLLGGSLIPEGLGIVDPVGLHAAVQDLLRAEFLPQAVGAVIVRECALGHHAGGQAAEKYR